MAIIPLTFRRTRHETLSRRGGARRLFLRRRAGARHRTGHLRLGAAGEVAAPGKASKDADRSRLADSTHQDRRGLLRGLRHNGEGRARGSVFSPPDSRAGSDTAALTPTPAAVRVWDLY